MEQRNKYSGGSCSSRTNDLHGALSSRPTSGRPPVSSFGTLGGQYSTSGQYGTTGHSYGAEQQYSAQYDAGYSQYGSEYLSAGYGSSYPAGSSYRGAEDYSTRAAYEDFLRNYGQDEMVTRALINTRDYAREDYSRTTSGTHFDSQTSERLARDYQSDYLDSLRGRAEAATTSSFGKYTNLDESASTATSGRKASRPTSAKPSKGSKSGDKGDSAKGNVFGRGQTKAKRPPDTYKQRSSPSRLDA